MHLSYGKIEFKIVRITDFVREIVYTPDMVSYLWDHVGIRAECVLNVAATSYAMAPIIGPQAGTFSPGVTYKAIAETLKRPRLKLLVWGDTSTDATGNAVGDKEIYLESPLGDYTVDAQNGPIAICHGLSTSNGNTTMMADLEFQTDVRTCPETKTEGKGSIPNPLVANRWTQRVEHDPTSHTAIIITEGQANFRNDMLQKYHYIPDMFRRYFIMPVPLGFRRDPPTIVIHPDGCTVSYSVVDREQILNFVGGQAYFATDISINEMRSYHKPR